jgi:leader peptidase (prepilin peptidase)/N-methyltransferase
VLTALLAGLFGLLIGSFLNVCIYRLPRDLSVVRPRSFCPACEKQIAAYDNIPVLSYLILGARCRHCKTRISIRYPLVELITGAAFFTAVLMNGPGLEAVKLCVFSAILIELIFSDLESRILPLEFTVGGLLAGLAFSFFTPIQGRFPGLSSPVEAALAAAVSSGVLWLVRAAHMAIRKREGLALGDLHMIAMMGAFLGVQGILLTVAAGSLLGAVVGLLYIWLARKNAGDYELPFGSFLGIAGLLMALFGQGLFQWYGQLG